MTDVGFLLFREIRCELLKKFRDEHTYHSDLNNTQQRQSVIMIRSHNAIMRNAVKIQVRYFRRRANLPTSHVTQLKSEITDKEINLHAESAEQVVADLKKLGFRSIDERSTLEKTFLDYLNATQSSFKKSSKNLNALKLSLTKNSEVVDNRMQIVFDYLLKEAEGEIRRLERMGPQRLEEEQRKRQANSFELKKREISSEKELEHAIFQDIISSSSPEDEKYSLLRNTEILFQVVSDLSLHDLGKENLISLEQMVQAFELSKLLINPEHRLKCILLSGNLLYSLKRVRMDPINESFYIDALVFYGFFNKALELFQSNQEKVNQRWWNEMGMMICLRANRIRLFDKLWSQTQIKFGKNCTNVNILKTAIKKKLFLRDFHSANKLTSQFVHIVEKYGCQPSITLPEAHHTKLFEKELEAQNFLNDTDIPTDRDFVSIIHSHLYRGNKKQALQLIAKFVATEGIEVSSHHILFLNLKLHLLKQFEVLKKDVGPFMYPETAEEKLEDLRKSFESLTNEMKLNNIRKSCNQIFFDSILSLSANPAFTSSIETFLVNFWMVPNDENVKSSKDLDISKKFRGLLDILLKCDKEAAALQVLGKMEELCTQEPYEGQNSNTFFVEANAHHYALFINYYKTKSKNVRLKSRKNYDNKVLQIVERMNSNEIAYNSVFLTSLLQYYSDASDFTNCFRIINPVLALKVAEEETAESFKTPLSFFDRRNITRRLYIEIWKTYEKYYTFFVEGSNSPKIKSNHAAWKHHVSSTRARTNAHPQRNLRELFKFMTFNDNILPDVHFYHIIIYTIIRSRDWDFLPAVLTFMNKVHGVPLNEKSQTYILNGLKRECTPEENSRLARVLSKKGGANDQNSTSTLKENEFYSTNRPVLQSDGALDEVLQALFEFVETKNNGDVTDFNESFAYLGIEHPVSSGR